ADGKQRRQDDAAVFFGKVRETVAILCGRAAGAMHDDGEVVLPTVGLAIVLRDVEAIAEALVVLAGEERRRAEIVEAEIDTVAFALRRLRLGSGVRHGSISFTWHRRRRVRCASTIRRRRQAWSRGSGSR